MCQHMIKFLLRTPDFACAARTFGPPVAVSSQGAMADTAPEAAEEGGAEAPVPGPAGAKESASEGHAEGNVEGAANSALPAVCPVNVEHEQVSAGEKNMT